MENSSSIILPAVIPRIRASHRIAAPCSDRPGILAAISAQRARIGY